MPAYQISNDDIEYMRRFFVKETMEGDPSITAEVSKLHV